MRVFTTVPQEDLRRVAAAAREIEADGYDGVASMGNKHDPFLALAIAGTATERIELHTGVAIAFARSPMAIANVGWDLSGATGGRFVVGLDVAGRRRDLAQILLRQRRKDSHRPLPFRSR